MKDSYHHGNLKEALIEKGLESLEREGVEMLSLRSLAKDLGVSKNAPYRHFSNKENFLGALSDEGFRQLCLKLESIGESGKEYLAELGKSYLAFAEERQVLYRLMFSPLMCRLPDEQMFWARKSLGYLCKAVTGKPAPDVNTTGQLVSAWAYLHGMVTLYLDGVYPDYLPGPDWHTLIQNIPFQDPEK